MAKTIVAVTDDFEITQVNQPHFEMLSANVGAGTYTVNFTLDASTTGDTSVVYFFVVKNYPPGDNDMIYSKQYVGVGSGDYSEEITLSDTAAAIGFTMNGPITYLGVMDFEFTTGGDDPGPEPSGSPYEVKQVVCNARDTAETLKAIMDECAESGISPMTGFFGGGMFSIHRLVGHDDDMMILYAIDTSEEEEG